MKDFIHAYWGDLIALQLIYLGLIVVWLGGSNEHIAHMGESLVFSGAITLRMKARDPKPVDPHSS